MPYIMLRGGFFSGGIRAAKLAKEAVITKCLPETSASYFGFLLRLPPQNSLSYRA